MRSSKRAIICAAAFAVSAIVAGTQAIAAPFTAGNLAVFQAASSSSNNTTFSIVEVQPSPIIANGVQTISINGTTGVDSLRISGSASSTGYLALSADRTLLAFDAVNADSSTSASNSNTITTRAVGTLDKTGAFVKQTTYTGTSGNQPRSATSLNNTNWYIGDQLGMYTNGTSSTSPAGNFRAAKTFGGTVYELTTTTSVGEVGTVSAITGGTYGGLPGVPNGQSASQDYYLISSGSNGSTFDVLYILRDVTGAGIGQVEKYSLVSGTWASNGTAATDFDGFGLAAADNGPGADLYMTSGSGATAANIVKKMVDANGFNQAISLGTATNILTAGAGTTFKGIDFVPVPEPTCLALAGALFPLLTRRRRA